MSIATCCHEVDEPICCSVDEGQIFSDGSKAITYGSYCAKCILGYYKSGTLLNKELVKLIEKLKGEK